MKILYVANPILLFDFKTILSHILTVILIIYICMHIASAASKQPLRSNLTLNLKSGTLIIYICMCILFIGYVLLATSEATTASKQLQRSNLT